MSLATERDIQEIRDLAKTGSVAAVLARVAEAVGPTDPFGAIEALRRALGIGIPLAKELACWRGFGGQLSDLEVERLGGAHLRGEPQGPAQ